MKRHASMSKLFIGFAKITGFPAALLFFKWRLYYADGAVHRRLPPCILMSNHTSLMDFVLYLNLFFTRTIRFLMAEVLFRKNRVFSRMLYRLGGIFVDRDAFDFGFMGETLETLDNGGTVGIFPQGRLPVGDKPLPFKSSIVYIALNTNVPIIPVFTDGNYGLFRRAHVIVGRPIYLRDHYNSDAPKQQEFDRLTHLLEDKTNELKETLEKRMSKQNEKLKTS